MPTLAADMDQRHKELLNKIYKEQDRSATIEGGKAYLRGNIVRKVKQSVDWARLLAWTTAIGVAIAILTYFGYIMYLAKESGTEFKEMRDKALIDMLELDQ